MDQKMFINVMNVWAILYQVVGEQRSRPAKEALITPATVTLTVVPVASKNGNASVTVLGALLPYDLIQYPEPLTNYSAAKENGNDNEGNKCLFITLNDNAAESGPEGGRTDGTSSPNKYNVHQLRTGHRCKSCNPDPKMSTTLESCHPGRGQWFISPITTVRATKVLGDNLQLKRKNANICPTESI
ncbi:hypothetical protein B0H13DRAFT_1861422 [Mycena leptocephala]|nr:hypothetical protein B0H13DRAFT_1861422 [Mycena leptocephala]